MIVEMLAGDEAAPDNVESITGTGFLARLLSIPSHHWLDSTIEHPQGLQIYRELRKCYDHKCDPSITITIA